MSMIKALRATAPMVFKAFPLGVIVQMLFALVHGLAWGFAAPANQLLYDALANAVNGTATISAVYWGAAAVTGVMLWQQVFNAVHNYFYDAVANKIRGKLDYKLHGKFSTLSAQVFEEKTKLDDIEKAAPGREGAIHLFLNLVDMVFFYSSYYAVMVGYLWRMKPSLVVAFIFIFAPVALSQIVQAKMQTKLEEISAPIRRKYGHYESCLIGKGKIKETRLFGAYYFFKRLYMDTLALLAQKDWDVRKKTSAMELGLNFVKAAGWVGVIVLMFNALMAKEISVGSFAAVFTAVGSLFSLLEELFGRVKRNMTDNLGKIHNFINFMALPERQGENIEPDFHKGITLTDVRFSYPTSPQAEKPAVDGVTLTIHYGETVALVGENGSGKTTLVKLLCGLYQPDSGSVIIGGRDTNTTTQSALFAKTSGLFQGYIIYNFTDLRNNVNISEWESVRDVAPALTNAGVDYNDTATFPNGLETILSREFEGVDLSGGQWQRVALARSLYRYHDFIVLDEPTAAIDPIEETRVYTKFKEFSAEKTAVVVTHRLGSARIADRIIVMDKGKIIETGTHEELSRTGGKYAEMWAAQAGHY